MVKIYGVEYLRKYTALEQFKIWLATCNDDGFEYEIKVGNKAEYKRDYPYLVKIDNDK